MARADLHTHTHFSPDGRTRPDQLLRRCREAGLTHVAVTDHHSIAGALAVEACSVGPGAALHVIVGQEIRTADGEVLGLYLRETIPEGLATGEAAARIREQGGLVVAPHPFDRLRPSLGEAGMGALDGVLDAVEGHNGRTQYRPFDGASRRYAAAQGLPCTLGSDAHSGRELGRSWLSLPDFEGPRELLAALSRAEPHAARPAPWLLPSSGLALAGWRWRRGRVRAGVREARAS